MLVQWGEWSHATQRGKVREFVLTATSFKQNRLLHAIQVTLFLINFLKIGQLVMKFVVYIQVKEALSKCPLWILFFLVYETTLLTNILLIYVTIRFSSTSVLFLSQEGLEWFYHRLFYELAQRATQFLLFPTYSRTASPYMVSSQFAYSIYKITNVISV